MASPKVYFLFGALLLVTAWAISTTESQAYEAEMATLDADEWSPKHGKTAEAEALLQEKAGQKIDPAETRFDDGADINNPTSLFPGPTYGLPGYKESHDWLKDLDWWSPLVFDWRYYKARCADGCNDGTALKDMTEGQIKKYWLEEGMDKLDKASSMFDCEYYVRQHEELHEDLIDANEDKVKCKDAVKQFLTEGVFDGLSGQVFDGSTFAVNDQAHWKVREHLCMKDCQPGTIKWDKNYAWTFWYMRTALGTPDRGNNDHEFLPVFAVRPDEDSVAYHQWGWWGGYPYFMTWRSRMMFCGATERWDCHWPIGEENSGIKGGWRFNWWSRWRLPPVNWWRFYGVMVDETGYTLYEFSDPPIIGNEDSDRNKRAHPHLPPAVHGFARKVATKSKGSWWGYDVHKPYHRFANTPWNHGGINSADKVPETCTKVNKCYPWCWDTTKGWHQRWRGHWDCRLKGELEKCNTCCESDGKIYQVHMHETSCARFSCECEKKWDEVEGVPMLKIDNENWEKVWTGFTVAKWRSGWWRPIIGLETPYWVMDLTYYRLNDHVFTEEEMEAIYDKGRSVDNV